MPRREGAGRPKLEDPKANKVSMRLSNEELARFEAYAVKHGLSKADRHTRRSLHRIGRMSLCVRGRPNTAVGADLRWSGRRP